jgi:hypothetical protein
MVTPENFIKPFEAVHADRLGAPTILPASAGGIFARTGFNRNKTDGCTVHHLLETILPALTNIVRGGGKCLIFNKKLSEGATIPPDSNTIRPYEVADDTCTSAICKCGFSILRHVSLILRDVSLNLRDASPNLRDVSPNLRDVSPNLRDVSLNFRDVSLNLRRAPPNARKSLRE